METDPALLGAILDAIKDLKQRVSELEAEFSVVDEKSLHERVAALERFARGE